MKNVIRLVCMALYTCIITSLLHAQSLSIVAPAISGYDLDDRDAHFNWQFQSSGGGNVQIGQFACGSYWVAPANGDSGVTVTSLTGNPAWTDYISCDADPITESHGLMGTKRLSSESAAAGKTAGPVYGSYNASENIIPNLPVTFTPSSGSCISLVAAIQRNEEETSPAGTDQILGEAVDAYCIVTILPAVPANNGSDMIRPNITGTTKEFLTWDDFDLTRIPTYPFLSGETTQGWENIRVRWTHSTEIFGMLTEDSADNFVKYSEGGRAFRSHIIIPDYGAGVHQNYSNDFFALLSSANTLTEKKPALAAMLAYGLDIYHNRYDYGTNKVKAWSSGAGQSLGTFLPPVLLASLLTDSTKANQLRKVAIDNHDEDVAKRGPHEMRQATRGVTGVLLWGDNTPFVRDGNNMNTHDREYWGRLVLSGCFDGSINSCSINGGSKAVADPYGYIDGPPNTPGYAYMSVAAGGVRSYASAMILMPAIRSVTNTDDPIEYTDRISRHGLWTYPDPLAIPSLQTQQEQCSIYPNNNCPGFGTTWGADPNDVRFAIEDGTGRFVSMHGDAATISNEASRSASNWSTIIDLYSGDTFEDNAVPLGTLVSPEIIFEFGSSPKAYIRTPNVLAEIRYTINGSDPTTSSTLYTAPVSVFENDVIRAKAFQTGKTASVVRTKTFKTPSLSDTTAPSVPANLIYSNLYSTSVDLDWDESTDDSGLVSGYNIYTNGSNPQFVSVNLTTVSGLTAETNYTFTISAVDAFGNESAQSTGVNVTTLAVGQTTGATALMLDFGPTSSSGSETNSPAHDTEVINATQTTWNHLSTSGSSSGTVSSLNLSDGNTASGISLTYGASAVGVKVIDFTASIGNTNTLGSSANTGIYANNSVATDGIWNLSGGSNDRSIGIRVDGLDTGSYKVFMMGRNTNTSSQGTNTYAVAASTASSFDYSSESPVLINNTITSSWSETGNYAKFDVTVGSGDSLYLISDGATSGENRGFLNAIQIVDTGSSSSDTEAPTVPTGLGSSNITTTSVNLSWNASTDNVAVTGYKVYINGTNPVTVSGPSTTITGLTQNTSYAFTVSAIDTASNESAQSSALNVTTADGQAPSVPTGLTSANLNASSVDLSWNASTDNVGVTGYKIYIDGANPISVTGTSTTITGLTAETQYSFTVSALDNAGNESSQSSAETVTTSAASGPAVALMIDFGPTTPTGSMLTNSPGHDTSTIDSAEDTWNVVATSASNSGTVSSLNYANGSSATGVSFTYGAAATGTTVIDFTASIASSNNLGSVANSGVYDTGSVARDGIWNAGSSSTDLPIGIRVDGLDAGNYTVFIMGRNTNTGTSASAMDTYAIAASNSSNYNFGSDTPVNLSNTSTASWIEEDNYTAISVSLSTGQSLYVITDGSVSTGERGFLNAIQIVSEGGGADTEAPTIPTGLGSSNITTTSVDLSWNASTDNVAVTGYKVYIDGANPVSVTGTSTSITGLTQNTTYAFTVTALDAASNESAQSAALNVTTADGQAPTVPSGLASSNITTTSVDLNWNASSDNVGVTGYKVYIDGSNPVSVSGTNTSITGLTPETQYDFTVSAIDAANNESSQSTAETVTTEPEPAVALMLDFGPTTPTGSMLTNSPGHNTSVIDNEDDTWNVVATSGGNSGTVSSLSYADGSSATGISFTYGAAANGTTLVDFTASIGSSNNLGSNASTGVYASGSVARDGIWNGGSSSSDLPIGIRVDGLDAGIYTVFVMGRNTNASSSTSMDIYAIAASNSSSYNFSSDSPTNISNTSTASWIEDDNYAAISVSLSSGQSLYIITDGSVSGGERGFLNAIQIVKP